MSEITDWDDAYANGPHVPGAEEYPPRWADDAAAYRASTPCEIDIPYGDHPRQRLDLFFPADPPRGLAVFIHGGYWLKFDKSSWSHFAEGARAAGWAVAAPSYVLAPEARLGEIAAMLAKAVAVAAARIDGPIRMAGHSAGGHLVSRLACAGGLAEAEAERLERVVSISGLHDLAPLMKTSMNADLRIDDEEALAESPMRLAPKSGLEVIAWVGAEERPEFLRQAALLETPWANASVRTVVEPERHHFNVIDGLRTREGALAKALAD